jgi:hypothetical protein
LDDADTGSKPVGPSKSLLLLAGMLGGLVVGLAVLLLAATSGPMVPVHPTPIRRAAIHPTPESTVGSDLDLIEAA